MTAINAWADSDPDHRWPRHASLEHVTERQLLEYLACLLIAVTGARVFTCERAGGDS